MSLASTDPYSGNIGRPERRIDVPKPEPVKRDEPVEAPAPKIPEREKVPA